MRRMAVAALSTLLLLAVCGGCDVGLGRKDPPGPGNSGRETRMQYSPEWTYHRSYTAWRVNHGTIRDQLEEISVRRNNRMIRKAAEDCGWALKSMKANLPEGRGKQLDPIIEGYTRLGRRATKGISSNILLLNLDALRRQVVADFSPDVAPIVAPRED